MRPTTLVISAMIASATQVSAWPEYNPMIPNGGNVNGGTNIGHVDEAGVEGVNEFGAAFEEAGDAWTAELCQADSDGDGQTNGQELGDPCCEFVFETNAVVLWTEGVSHPSDSTSMSDPSLWESIDCSSSGTTTTAASNSTGAAEEEETGAEETSAEEASTEEMGSMAMSSEGTSTEETTADESSQTSESTSGTTEATTSSGSGISDESTASSPASTPASTPAATNSAVQDRAFIAGATAAAFAAAALW